MNQEFYTLKGYQMEEKCVLTPAMEDYLEMIYRIIKGEKQVRIRDLSQRLNVRPSSTTKMVQQLARQGYLDARRYGVITLTDEGKLAGSYLYHRHHVIQCFLQMLNGEDCLEETEKIEHFLHPKTIANLERLCDIIGKSPGGDKHENT